MLGRGDAYNNSRDDASEAHDVFLFLNSFLLKLNIFAICNKRIAKESERVSERERERDRVYFEETKNSKAA